MKCRTTTVATRGRRSLGSLAIGLVLGASFAVADDPPIVILDEDMSYVPEPTETYPTGNGRMYDVDREALYDAVQATLNAFKFRIDKEVDTRGIITRKRVLTKKLEGLGPFPETGGRTVASVALHFWIPDETALSRLYIGSIVWQNAAPRNRIFMNHGHVERWFYEQVERRLSAKPLAIPAHAAARAELIGSVLGANADRECLSRLNEPLRRHYMIGSPTLIEETKISPIYPGRAAAREQQGELILWLRIAEDGTVHHADVLRDFTRDAEFVTSAIQTVKLWRYEPVVYKGCPLAMLSTVLVSYKLR